jgi:hypothetical protein
MDGAISPRPFMSINTSFKDHILSPETDAKGKLRPAKFGQSNSVISDEVLARGVTPNTCNFL